ncbi:hypothetical protein NC653_026048 [Populus alba x Populus x berolinensis]|uniref:Uncharacterized protein n=1 Tax=Populus alba x Populus x berolinensis TaxID=444605 RepID=A0AAD6MCT0_9ROSI|nr:hypothetical protein NC653_026044 [Populus alba x Populus x berolinensis]KAJ6983108.1 hypothetical protein NC653_026048 [Populus alba x Populus x berolinensis]
MEIAKHKRRRSRRSESQALACVVSVMGKHFLLVFSFNNRAIEKALLLHFLFKSRKFCFLETGESKSPFISRNDTRRNFGREFKNI